MSPSVSAPLFRAIRKFKAILDCSSVFFKLTYREVCPVCVTLVGLSGVPLERVYSIHKLFSPEDNLLAYSGDTSDGRAHVSGHIPLETQIQVIYMTS